MPTELER